MKNYTCHVSESPVCIVFFSLPLESSKLYNPPWCNWRTNIKNIHAKFLQICYKITGTLPRNHDAERSVHLCIGNLRKKNKIPRKKENLEQILVLQEILEHSHIHRLRKHIRQYKANSLNTNSKII